MENMKGRKPKTKLTRTKWLELSLEVLIKEGNTKLRIDHLVRCLGVTKGSFYWHFKDRNDFIFSLIEYWADVSSLGAVEHMKQIQGSAEERLFELMRFIVSTIWHDMTLPSGHGR
jgi:AcrR family transcriptional regulator